MKFTLTVPPPPNWNGKQPLPAVIHTVTSEPRSIAEHELLMMICGLHGYVCALDLLTGADPDTEKDTDLISVLSAFQAYIGSSRMPLSCYTADGGCQSSISKK